MYKKLFPIIFLILIVCQASLSCSDEVIEENLIDSPEESLAQSQNVSVVSLDNIITVISHDNQFMTRGESNPTPVQIFVDFLNDTLLYIVNRPCGGWRIFSADKRIPPILADCPFGSYEEAIENEMTAEWIEMMAYDVKAVKHTPTENLNLTEEEILSNINFWNLYCSPEDFIASISETRSHGPLKPGVPFEDKGHYELDGIYSTEVVYDSIEHLTRTHWHQGSPYNACCPIATESTNGERCAAGCTAIAGAQLLYYLHFYLRIPMNVPYYSDWIDGVYNYLRNQNDGLSNPTDSALFCHNYDAAPLVATIGHLLNSNYSLLRTSGSLVDLAEVVFPHYGIICEECGYEQSIVDASLARGVPVIVGAYGKKTTDWFGLVSHYEYGHSFLIDGYKRFCIKTTAIYHWKFDDNSAMHQCVDDSIVVSYTSPYITQIRMNWGYRTDVTDRLGIDAWYIPTGDWRFQDEDNHEYNYVYKRRLIHSFRRNPYF